MTLRSASLGRGSRPALEGGRLWLGDDGRVVRADEAACSLLGSSPAKLTKKHIREILHSHRSNEPEVLLSDLSEVWCEAPDGTRRPLIVGVGQEEGLLVLCLRDGTARSDARNRHLQTEEQLRKALRIAHVGTWTWDLVNDHVEASPEYYLMCGLDPRTATVSYEQYLSLVHPDDLANLRNAVEQSIKTGKPSLNRHRIIRPDGEVRNIMSQSAAEVDADGEAVLLYGVIQDVTDQVAPNKRMEAMLESAPDAMVLVDDKGIIRFINNETERMFGYDRDELVGKAVEVLVPEALRGDHEGHRANYHTKPKRRRMGVGKELEARRKDGTTFPAEISLSPMKSGEETLVTAAIRDITERHHAEQVDRDRQARIESLLANALDAVVLTDLEGRIAEWNPAAERMFGRTSEEVLGKRFQDFAMPPQAKERFLSLLNATQHGLDRKNQVWETDLEGFHGTVPVEASLARVENDDKTYLLAVLRDVTERRKAEESDRLAFERLIEIQQLREVNRFKTILLNTASHELNTPMTPLRLQLHLLESERLGELAPRQRHAVEVLQRNVERLSMLIQDVLDVARLESGKLKIVQKPLRMASVVQEALDTFGQAIEKANLAVDLQVDNDPHVKADRNRLVQVLVNLISNAIKFSPHGGRISLHVLAQDGDALVQVTDDGPGLEPKQIGDLFQPFARVHDALESNVPGTGLGLYICKGILEQHAGTIGVESEGRGKGSTFWFRLPLWQEGQSPA